MYNTCINIVVLTLHKSTKYYCKRTVLMSDVITCDESNVIICIYLICNIVFTWSVINYSYLFRVNLHNLKFVVKVVSDLKFSRSN